MLDFLAMISDQMRAGFPGLVDASHWDVVEPCMGTYVALTNSHFYVTPAPRPQTVDVNEHRVIICHVLDFSRPTFIREADGRTVLIQGYISQTIRV